MRVALWFTLRLAATRAYLVIASLVAVPLLVADPTTRQAALTAGLNDARDLAVYLVPAYVAAVWGTLGDARADAAWRLAGADPRRVRCRFLAVVVGCVLLGVGVVVLVAAVGPTDPTGTGARSGGDEVRRAAIYLVLTLVAAAASAVVMVGRRGRGAAVAVGVGIPLVHVVLVHGQLPGRLLWMALWPTSAGGFIARGQDDDADVLRLVASLSLTAVIVAVAAVIDPLPRRTARRLRPRSADRTSRGVLAGASAALTGVVAIGLLPSLLVHLPAGSRPSLLVQTADGRGPSDVAGLFYQFLRQGDLDQAARHARGGKVSWTPRLEQAGALRGGASFTLASSTDLTHADVRGQVGRASVCVRLVFQREGTDGYRWLVRDLSLGECDA